MKSSLPAALCALLLPIALSAQTSPSTGADAWSSAVTALAQGAGAIAVPASAISAAPGTAAYEVASAGLLLAAANQAPAARRAELFQAARQDLLEAERLGFADAQTHGACAYLLGYLTERLGGTPSAARAYYQESANAGNDDGAKALARVNATVAVSQGG